MLTLLRYLSSQRVFTKRTSLKYYPNILYAMRQEATYSSESDKKKIAD